MSAHSTGSFRGQMHHIYFIALMNACFFCEILSEYFQDILNTILKTSGGFFLNFFFAQFQ